MTCDSFMLVCAVNKKFFVFILNKFLGFLFCLDSSNGGCHGVEFPNW